MPKKADIKQKAIELRVLLERYNGMPTIKEHREDYCTLFYYLKNYRNVPEIKKLIDDFSVVITPKKKFEEKLKEVQSILEKNQAMPYDHGDYVLVYNFFAYNKERPEVERLMYIYSSNECYTKVTGNPLHGSYHGYSGERSVNLDEYDAYRYVKYVFRKYRELPGINTIPMKIIRVRISDCVTKIKFKKRGWYNQGLRNFLQVMKDEGCKDKGFIDCLELIESHALY